MATIEPLILGLEGARVATRNGEVYVEVGGGGTPVLLLHGFPETSLMWRDIAPRLAPNFTIVAADLPGYGRSDCPDDGADHAGMSKRQMAATLVEAMHRLGHPHFAVVGHDRGGRVAYRAALDHPQAITHVAVLDVIPTLEVWERADARMTLAFWPFSLLAQPAPLPERLVGSAPETIIDNALGYWGSPASTFPAEVRRSYVNALRDPLHVHAICEEYRAAAGIDREHDEADLAAGRRIACPLLALWSATGGLDSWYREAGGPLEIWRRWADKVSGGPVSGGHFFAEEAPDLTAQLLSDFLGGGNGPS
jgi:haloacetate dehalogenase